MGLATIIAIFGSITVASLMLGLMRLSQRAPEQETFERNLADFRESELESELDQSQSEIRRDTWGGFWLSMYVRTGREYTDPNGPGRFVAIASVITSAIGFLVWPRDIIAGLAFLFVFPVLTYVFFRYEAKKRIKRMDGQLPQLISSMQSNLQANQTVQSALLQAADNIPSPLGDELIILRREVESNISLATALDNLEQRVPSQEMKFLISSIKIAIESGQDLGPQLTTIQDIITQRTQLQQKLAAAVAEGQPALIVTGVVIPGSLLFSMYSSEANRQFWFSPMGLICGIIVGFLYVAGLFVVRKLISRVENS